MGSIASLVALSVVLGVLGCAYAPAHPPAPPPDADAAPATAQPLALGVTHSDGLDRSEGDLDDWYRVELTASGALRIDVSAAEKDGSVPEYSLRLTDETGATELARVRAGGRTRIELSHRVQAGTYLIWVGSEPESPGPVAYEIRASFVPRAEHTHRPPRRAPVVRREHRRVPSPPPAPQFRVVTAPLLEVENAEEGGQTIVLAAGQDQGLSPGLQGRVLDGGTELGTFEVVDVYPHGCRVRVVGRLKGAVTQGAVAEIRVPLGHATQGGD